MIFNVQKILCFTLSTHSSVRVCVFGSAQCFFVLLFIFVLISLRNNNKKDNVNIKLAAESNAVRYFGNNRKMNWVLMRRERKSKGAKERENDHAWIYLWPKSTRCDCCHLNNFVIWTHECESSGIIKNNATCRM